MNLQTLAITNEVLNFSNGWVSARFCFPNFGEYPPSALEEHVYKHYHEQKRSTVQRSELYIHIVKAAANGVSVCKCEVAMLRMEMVDSPRFGELISCTEIYPNIRKKVHPTSPLSQFIETKLFHFDVAHRKQTYRVSTVWVLHHTILEAAGQSQYKHNSLRNEKSRDVKDY